MQYYSDRNMAGQKKKRKELKRELEEMKIANIALAQAIREIADDHVRLIRLEKFSGS